jgi:hypothetical protein
MGESILTRKGASGGGVGNYSTFVAQAQDNSKYTVYTGYDFVSNPTPNLSNNFAFNQWELNNSATGSVILSNVVVTNAGMFNGPNATFNEANIPFINSTASYSGNINNLGINNGFIYVGGLITGTTANVIRKYREDNLAIVGNTAGFNFAIQSLAFNNGFIFAGGVRTSALFVTKFHESNLVNTNTVSYGGVPYAIAINNGYVYVGGTTEETVKKYHESNLVLVDNTISYLETIRSIAINNGFIYAGGEPRTGTNRGVAQYHEANLVRVGNTANYASDATIFSIVTNNGFLYGELFDRIRGVCGKPQLRHLRGIPILRVRVIGSSGLLRA